MKKIKRHRGPSKASLREMPEIDFKTAKFKPNPYAKRIAREGMTITIDGGPGKPKKVIKRPPTGQVMVSLPVDVCEQLEKRAKAEGIGLRAALRQIRKETATLEAIRQDHGPMVRLAEAIVELAISQFRLELQWLQENALVFSKSLAHP